MRHRFELLTNFLTRCWETPQDAYATLILYEMSIILTGIGIVLKPSSITIKAADDSEDPSTYLSMSSQKKFNFTSWVNMP